MRTNAPVLIRRKEPADDAFLLRTAGEAFGEYSRGPERSILRMAEAGSTLVATEQGRPIGFAIVEFSTDRDAHLTAISVAESERGRGIGKTILAAVERLVRERGARTLVLVTADSNVAALELFLGCGFRRAKALPEYYARGQNAVYMKKDLQ